MNSNLGAMDRKVRLSIASAMYWIVALGLTDGVWAFLPMLTATLLVVTWHEQRCPIYHFFGWSTADPLPRRRVVASIRRAA